MFSLERRQCNISCWSLVFIVVRRQPKTDVHGKLTSALPHPHCLAQISSNQLLLIHCSLSLCYILRRLCVMVASGTLVVSEASSSPTCRTQGCNFIGVDRFGGHCCFMCQKGKGFHGLWCPGTHGADPGPHPYVLDERIEVINTKLRQLEAGFKTTCILVGVTCASLLVHKLLKSR